MAVGATPPAAAAPHAAGAAHPAAAPPAGLSGSLPSPRPRFPQVPRRPPAYLRRGSHCQYMLYISELADSCMDV